MFVWKKNRHFWTAACGFAWLPGRFGDEEIHNITNFAHVEASWPSPSLSTSSAELTRDLHDLALSLALSVMRRLNGGRYAPTSLKKKHEESPSVEPGTSQAFLKYFGELDTTMCTTSCRQYPHFLVSIFPYACNVCVRLEEGGFNSNEHRSFETKCR